MDKLIPLSKTIKPCPFCGEIPTFSAFPYTDIIKCENPNCYVQPGTSYGHPYCKHDIECLIKMWNRRDGDG